MDNTVVEGDRLYLIAESLAQDHSLLPSADVNAYGGLRGLLTPFEIARENKLDGVIETQYKTGAGILEPWHPDTVGLSSDY